MAKQKEVVHVEIKRRGNSLGMVSLILGILAFVICWIPLLGVLGVPLSGLGVVLGGIGLVIALARKGASIGFPIAGLAMCGLALTIALTVTGAVVSEVARVSENAIENQRLKHATNQELVAQEGVGDDDADGADPVQQPAGEAVATVEWAPHDQPVRQGDIQVQILGASVGKVSVDDALSFSDEPSYSAEDLLAITLSISNLSETKKITYRTWAGADFSFDRDYATLRDEHENTYARSAFGSTAEPVGRTRHESIRPGESVTDVLVFERPIDAAEALRLELPAENFGGEGMLRIELPVSAVESNMDATP